MACKYYHSHILYLHTFLKYVVSTYLYTNLCLSIYLSTLIDLCLSFYKVLMFICTRNKIIISYAYFDDPGYKFRQLYENNGKRKTKYGIFIIL